MGGSDKLQNVITLKTKKEIEEMNKRVKAERKKVLCCLLHLSQNSITGDRQFGRKRPKCAARTSRQLSTCHWCLKKFQLF